MLCLVYTLTRKVTDGKNASFHVLAAAPWAELESLKAVAWLLLGRENGQQGAGPRPPSGPGREGNMQESAAPCSRERDAPGKCRNTEELQH